MTPSTRRYGPQGPAARPGYLRHLAVATGMLALLAACDGDDAQQTAATAEPPAVSVIAVETTPVTATFEQVGRTKAAQEVDVRARVSGILLQRTFEEGGVVTANQQLFQIDPAEFEAARKAAAAAVARARATLTEAQQSLTRARELVKRGNISQANVDKAVAAEAQAKADLAARQADLERAELDLSYTIIETPIEGRASAAKVDVGNLIGPDSGVLTTIVDSDPIQVVFAVTERGLLSYREQQQAGNAQDWVPRLRLANGAMFDQTGTIAFIDNRVDPRTGTVEIRADFPNPTGLVVPGQYVTVVLSSSESRNEIVVPQAAVQQNQVGAFLLVVGADNKVEARPVTLGQRDGTGIVVSEGLQPGETVIVDGLQKARAGAMVRPVPAQTGSGADKATTSSGS